VKTTSIINLLQLALSIVTTIVLVVTFELGILGVLLGTLAGSVFSAIGLFAVTAKSFVPQVDYAKWRAMMAYGLPFMPHHLQAVGMELFGVYIVGQRLGIDQAGLYTIATRFAVPLSFTVAAVQQAWTAYKFHRHRNDENPQEFFRTAVTYYIAGLMYLWLGVSVWCPELVRVMTPEDFHGALLLIPIVALPRVTQVFYFMFSTGIEIGGKSTQFPLITAAGLATVLGSTFPLVAVWGAFGAALATALGWVVMAAVAYYFAQKQFRIEYEWKSLSIFLAVAITLVSIGYAMQSWATAPRLVGAVCLSLVYPVVCLLVLLRSQNERERMQIALAKIGWRRPVSTESSS
jgi:O-antigen/teichoic acid export membrane protein